MSVIPITLFFSLLLASIFVVLFWRDQSRRFASAERDSLLPLAEEQPRTVPDEHPAHENEHDHADDGCGCRDGTRPPCTGCLRHAIPISRTTTPHHDDRTKIHH